MSEAKKVGSVKLDALREKYKNLLEPSASSGTEFFQTDSGTYVIRLLPPMGNSFDPFVTVYYHGKMGEDRKTTTVCPGTYDKPCAICEYRFKLLKSENPAHKELAKQYKRKSKSYCNILIKGFTDKVNASIDSRTLINEERFSVKVYGLHWTMYKELMGYLINPQFGDITDIHNGYDFTYVIADNKATGYRDHKIMPMLEKTPISKDKAIIDKVFGSMADLEMFKKEVSYEDTVRLRDETLYGERAVAVSSTVEVPVANVTMTSTSSAPVQLELTPSGNTESKNTAEVKRPELPVVPEKKVETVPEISKKRMACFGVKYTEIDPVCSFCPDKDACQKLVSKLG